MSVALEKLPIFEITLFLLLSVLCFPVASSASPVSLDGVNVLITAPPSYAGRLKESLERAGATVISCPTVCTEFLSERDDDLTPLIEALKKSDPTEPALNYYDYVAFTSRRGIEAALRVGGPGLIRCFQNQNPIAIALGIDAEALLSAGVDQSSLLVPEIPSPNGIVDLLEGIQQQQQEINKQNDEDKTGSYGVQPGRMQKQLRPKRILCPVPKVVSLTEPPVVPEFVAALRRLGLHVDRVDAYTTSWTGPSPHAYEAIQLLREGKIQVLCISSTAEVEGLLLLCQHYNVDILNILAPEGAASSSRNGTHNNDSSSRRSNKDDKNMDCSSVRIAAHGPVTARGAQALGVMVHAISKDSSSFAGMVGAVAECMIQQENAEKKD